MSKINPIEASAPLQISHCIARLSAPSLVRRCKMATPINPIDIDVQVSRGLLPESLPPVFTAAAIMPCFAQFGLDYTITSKAAVGTLVNFNASKRGGQRRSFGIPHPAFLRDQSIFFREYWERISTVISSSSGSLSTPQFDPTSPRAVQITPHRELPKRRLKKLSRYKFCLLTDVSRFFHSIYTHSIPWAIHGKASAKAEKNKPFSKAVFGNRLDYIVRQAQNGQTIGIPVGPDSSKIISELLMAVVDSAFVQLSKRGPPSFVRHVDDYWIGGGSIEECEEHLHNIRSALRLFELDINELKTKILSTKFIFSDAWPVEFEHEIIACLQPKSGRDPLSVLGRVIERATADNDDGLIRYVIRKMDDRKLWNNDWELLEHFLAQSAIQFPHSFDYVARVIAWQNRCGTIIDKPLWNSVVESIASQCANTGRDSEVIWALWLLKELDFKISRSLSDLIILNCSPLVLSLLAHCYSEDLTSDQKVAHKLRQRVEGDPFAGSYWPLALELNHLGIGMSQWKNQSAADSLRVMYDKKISLIKWDSKPKVFDFFDDDNPDHAIERHSEYYDEEVESEEPDQEELPELGPPANLFDDLSKML